MNNFRIFSLTHLALVTSTSAAVIQSDALIVSPTTAPSHIESFYLIHDRQLILAQSAPPGDGMFLYEVSTSSPGSFTFTYSGIAEPNGLVLVEADDRFDLGFITAEPSFANNWDNPGSGTLFLNPGESRYLGYWADQLSGDDLFGWSRITNLGGELVVEESATALGGGIIVGTLHQIPEPCMGALAVSGSLIIFILRTRRPSAGLQVPA